MLSRMSKFAVNIIVFENNNVYRCVEYVESNFSIKPIGYYQTYILSFSLKVLTLKQSLDISYHHTMCGYITDSFIYVYSFK